MRGLFRAVLCCLAVLVVTPASAAEKLRVVKAVAFAWTFTPLDVGIEMPAFSPSTGSRSRHRPPPATPSCSRL